METIDSTLFQLISKQVYEALYIFQSKTCGVSEQTDLGYVVAVTFVIIITTSEFFGSLVLQTISNWFFPQIFIG